MTAPLPVEVSEPALEAWGRTLGARLSTPAFLGLEGPLGAGKSALARAIGRGAGVRGPMPSPSYNLLLRHPGRDGREVVHLDLYRLSGPDELDELGWSELGRPGEIVLVEWAERAGRRLPADRVTVRLGLVPGRPSARSVSVEAHGRAPDVAPPAPAGGL